MRGEGPGPSRPPCLVQRDMSNRFGMIDGSLGLNCTQYFHPFFEQCVHHM